MGVFHVFKIVQMLPNRATHQITPLSTLMSSERLRWLGHVSRCEDWINQCLTLDVAGKHGEERPRNNIHNDDVDRLILTRVKNAVKTTTLVSGK